MEKLSQTLLNFFLRNKYTVFTMGGTAALRFVTPATFLGEIMQILT